MRSGFLEQLEQIQEREAGRDGDMDKEKDKTETKTEEQRKIFSEELHEKNNKSQQQMRLK